MASFLNIKDSEMRRKFATNTVVIEEGSYEQVGRRNCDETELEV